MKQIILAGTKFEIKRPPMGITATIKTDPNIRHITKPHRSVHRSRSIYVHAVGYFSAAVMIGVFTIMVKGHKKWFIATINSGCGQTFNSSIKDLHTKFFRLFDTPTKAETEFWIQMRN
jgi:hypothetical protein